MINFRLYLSKKSDANKNMVNFVKIYFQAKDIEEVHLSSIFRKHLDSIPSTFQSKDPPTVLYSRSSNTGSTIFNYKDVVNSVITDEWKEDNSYVCNCSKSAFCEAVTRLSKNVKKTKKMTLKSPVISKLLVDLQKDFVFVPTDKASNISLLSVRNFTLNNL